MPVPRAPVAPLHTMVSFVSDVEDGGFAQMAQESQQKLWDMEVEAIFWREKAMAHRTVVQRVTQDVSRQVIVRVESLVHRDIESRTNIRPCNEVILKETL